MKIRTTIATIATVIGILLLRGFKTPPNTAVSALNTRSRQSAPPTPTSTPSSDAPAASTAAPSNATQNGLKSGTFTGDDVQTQFGDIQVSVTIASGRITDVNALHLPYDHERSLYISQTVRPWLHDEVLQAQSARIDVISGATYTSEAYAESLQSALDKAHA
ncbi:MAG: FMN-binding protein [Actinomycetota bacterium]